MCCGVHVHCVPQKAAEKWLKCEWSPLNTFYDSGKKSKLSLRLLHHAIKVCLGGLQLQAFFTSALDATGQLHVSADLLPGKVSPIPTVQETEWVSQLVWTLQKDEKSPASTENGTAAVKPAFRRYIDSAIPTLLLE
jgi:hypothetical protein